MTFEWFSFHYRVSIASQNTAGTRNFVTSSAFLSTVSRVSARLLRNTAHLPSRVLPARLFPESSAISKLLSSVKVVSNPEQRRTRMELAAFCFKIRAKNLSNLSVVFSQQLPISLAKTLQERVRFSFFSLKSRRRIDPRSAHFALEGSIAAAGSVIRWLRDNLGLIKTSSDAEALASQVPDSGSFVFVPAFNGLFAPRWRPDARGTMTGITQVRKENTRMRSQDHFFSLRPNSTSSTALLNPVVSKPGTSLTLLLKVVLVEIDNIYVLFIESGSMPLSMLRVDGGMTSNKLLLQRQADLLQVCYQLKFIIKNVPVFTLFIVGLLRYNKKIKLCFTFYDTCLSLGAR